MQIVGQALFLEEGEYNLNRQKTAAYRSSHDAKSGTCAERKTRWVMKLVMVLVKQIDEIAERHIIID